MSSPQTASPGAGSTTAVSRPFYTVRAGGPDGVVGLTNTPASNRVWLTQVNSSYDTVSFSVTNGEPHAILLWNVRVQVRSKGKGTDGFGWDTVDDDYPVVTGNSSSPRCAPGASVRFEVRHPQRAPWRVCILYSSDWTDSGKTYWGNYEAITGELQE